MIQTLLNFLSVIEVDPRITKSHISVYISLWKKWMDSGQEGPLSVFRSDVIDLCKISSCNSYHKTIKQLHEFGYIRYEPSFDHYKGSIVYFIKDCSTLKSIFPFSKTKKANRR